VANVGKPFNNDQKNNYKAKENAIIQEYSLLSE
jgi:hypothetical protein